jgi:hypothetical protein
MRIIGTTLACTIYCVILALGFLISMPFTGKQLRLKGFGLRRSGGNNFGPSFGADSHPNLPGF